MTGNGSGESRDPLAAIRKALAHVREKFDGLGYADCEDAVSEAYVRLLDRQVSGRPVGSTDHWLRTVAENRATDEVRRRDRQAQAVDDEQLAALPDTDCDVFERMLARGVLARFVAAVHLLPVEQREALRLAAEWRRGGYTQEHRPWKRLGITRSAYFYRVSQGMAKPIEDATADYTPRLEAWVKQTITACLAGCADRADERRLMLLVREDPKVAAIYRELSRAHDVAAATLPPVAIAQAADPSLIERVGAVVSRAKERVLPGGDASEAIEVGASQLSVGGGMRGAGAASAGVAAKLAALGGAGKVALGCVTGSAALSACIAAGVLPGPGLLAGTDERGSPPQREAVDAREASSADQVDVVVSPSPLEHQEPQPAPEPEPSEPAEEEEPPAESAPSEPTDYLAPSTPPVEREFGVASAGTPVTSSGSSSPPSGGSGDSGVPSDPVQREFGP